MCPGLVSWKLGAGGLSVGLECCWVIYVTSPRTAGPGSGLPAAIGEALPDCTGPCCVGYIQLVLSLLWVCLVGLGVRDVMLQPMLAD